MYLKDTARRRNWSSLMLHERLQIDRYWYTGDPEYYEEKMKIEQLLKLRNNIVREKFRNRTDHIKKVCEQERVAFPNSDIFHQRKITFLWSIEPYYKLLLCRTAKHGSTSWARNLVRIYTQG